MRTTRTTRIGPTTYSSDDERARGLRVALASRATSPVSVLFMGASSTEGWNATSRANRFINVAASKLGTYLGQRIGDYDPVSVSGFTWGYGSHWTVNAGTVSMTGSGNPNYGLGLRASLMNVGSDIQKTYTCSGFTVFYITSTSLAGSIQVYIDGVLTTTINTLGASLKGGRQWSSDALSYGSHTIRLVQSGSFGALVEGVYAYGDDRAVGIRFYDNAHFGYTTTNYNNVSKKWDDGFDLLQPACHMVLLGHNDLSLGTFRTNLEALTTRLKAGSTLQPTIILTPGGFGSQNTSVYQRALVAKNIADQTGCLFLDTYSIIGDISTSDPYALSDDDIHLNDLGHAVLGNAIAGYLADIGGLL